MSETILSEYEYTIRKDIKPSQIELPIENWRTTPNKDVEKLIKSIARVGLLHPPIVALYVEPKNGYIGAVIDGNRRIFAAQQLEKGYQTNLNNLKVNLALPDNWRVAVTTSPYEKLTSEDKDRIRLHSTEQHIHFTFGEMKTRMTRTAIKYASERGLRLNKIYHNKALFNEMLEFMTEYYYLDKVDLIKLLKEVSAAEIMNEKVDAPLHFGEITRAEAKALSQGLAEKYIDPLLTELIKLKKEGYNEPQTIPALYNVKEMISKDKINTDLSTILRKEVNKIPITRKLTIAISDELYQKITEEKTKRRATLNDIVAPVLQEYFLN